jgi:hypothetical protein
MVNGINRVSIKSIGTFREWLREEEVKELTEVFDYTPDYREISRDDFIEYEKKIAVHIDANALKTGLDIDLSDKRNRGPRVHHYIYKDFLIFYGKFKNSKKYEVHFWNIKDLSFESLGGNNNYSTAFSGVMSILKDKHFDVGRVENVYIKHKEPEKILFYEKIIQKMLNKFKLDWFIQFDSRGLYISKNKYIMTEREFKIMKQISVPDL